MTQPLPSSAHANVPASVESELDLRNVYFYKLNHDRPAIPPRPGTVILDLEDGVCTCDKAPRRRAIREVLDKPLPHGVSVLVRCHGLDDAGGMLLDLDAVSHPALRGFILPMVSRVDEVESFDQLLTEKERELGLQRGHFAIHLLIEIPEAYLDLADLARASSRVASIMFGREDFMSRFPKGGNQAAHLAEAQIPLIAAAIGVPAIASPYCAVADPKGFVRYCQRTRDLGYSGTFTVHPSQRPAADDAFAPSALDIQSAQTLIQGTSESQLVRMNGCLVGPPMRRRAEALLHESDRHSSSAGQESTPGGATTIDHPASEGIRTAQATVPSRKGRLPTYGVDTSTTQVGSILESPHAYTLDEGWRAKWFAHFPTSDAVLTSEPAAQAFGFDERPLPFSLLLNLCLCLSVEPFSQTCRFHLGLRDARQIAPVRMGDTVRARIRVEALRNTSAGDAAVIVTTHILENQHGEVVFALTKDSYYAAIPGLEGRAELDRTGAEHVAFDTALTAQAHSGAGARVDNGAYLPSSIPVSTGEVILHPAVRPIGWSENLELTTLVRNTHPIHFDAQRYGRKGIVVCGGFVQALVQGLASPEFRQVIEERLIHSFHAGTVMPEDRLGALSRVLEVRDLGDGTEEVVVSTLGLINVDVEQELVGVAIPDALFGPEPVKPATLRALCTAHCPVLENRIALRAVRVLRRIKAEGQSYMH
jgi:citrate lyase beta subunit/acyl dehydratase